MDKKTEEVDKRKEMKERQRSIEDGNKRRAEGIR
jgi:hypothetical protein